MDIRLRVAHLLHLDKILKASNAPLAYLPSEGKRPVGNGWEERQFLTSKEAATRLAEGGNVSYYTGPRNNSVVIIDLDSNDALDLFHSVYGPEQPYVRIKGRKGFHYYFLIDAESTVAKRNYQDSKVDVFGPHGKAGAPVTAGSINTAEEPHVVYELQVSGTDTLPVLNNAVWLAFQERLEANRSARVPARRTSTMPNEFGNLNAARWGFRKSKTYDAFYRWLDKNSIAATLEDGREGYFTALMYYVRTNYNANEQQCYDIAELENEAWAKAGARHSEGKGRFDDQVLRDKARRAVERVMYVEPEERQDPTVIARGLADSLTTFIRFTQGANVLPGNYEYVDGVYHRRSDDNQNNGNLVRNYLCANEMESLCRNSLVAEIRDQFLYLLTERNPSNKVPDNHWLDGREDDTCYIPMKSCLVDVKKYAMARASGIVTDEWRHDHTPLYFTEGKRQFDVDPDAKCPTFEVFISQLLPSPDTRAEFQKHVGMILLPRTKVRDQVAMHLDGPAGAGKSTILNILRALVSKSSTLPYRQMVEGTHPMLAMLNSDLNIDGDVSSTSLDITTFNKVVEGAYMSWNEKNKPIFQARVSAHCVSAGNNFFNLSRDKASAGFWRRMRVYPCFNTEYIQDLEAKLAAELPGIFNWAADGLAQYLCNGLGSSAEMTAFIDEQKEKDSLHDFITSTCTAGPEKYTTRGIIYPAYEAFCRSYGYSPLSWSSFKERCIQAGFFTNKDPVTKRLPQFTTPVKVFVGVEWVGDQSVSLDTSGLRKAMQTEQLTSDSKIIHISL